ncbi:MAG TPA: LuxR C-terminal-related transcriptional regulator [Actinomycetota bacterium]|jgi:DNA-binding CsgD family transcriptional regulator
MGAAWPLVGRGEELTAIQAAMDDAAVSGVVLAGTAGVGKTRLAREALTRARAQGLATRWAVATQAASPIPFGALAQLLPDPGSTAPDQARRLHQAARALQAEAGTRRLVLGVDDAHLLDRVSAALVHQLAAASAAFVVVTTRSGAPVPDAILSLWKDGLAERLELHALARGEVEELVVAVLGGQVDGLTLQRLSTATRGNVLLLRELVLAGRELGQLERRERVWRWSGPLAVTPRLAELIEARLGHLDGSQRAVLELLAAGEPLGPRVLAELTGPGAAEALERRGLVTVEHHGRRLEVRLAHPLYGEVLRGRTPRLRARVARRQLADALEALGTRRREDLLRVAIWHLDAGGPTRPELLTAAARQVVTADAALAERLARAAVAAGGAVDAAITLGQALSVQRRLQEAEVVLAGLADQALTDQQRTELATRRSTNLIALRRYRQGIEELQQAAATVTDRGLRDRLATAQANHLLLDGRGDDALDVASAVLAREPADEETRARATTMVAWALVQAGHANQAVAAIARQGYLGGQAGKERPWLSEVEWALCGAYVALGRSAEAEAIATGSYQRSVASQWALGIRDSAFTLMLVALARGRVRTAVRWVLEGLAQVSDAGDATIFHFDLVLPLALAGDLDAAEQAFRKADVAQIGRSRLFLLAVEEARWWIAAGRGDLSGAVQRSLATADLAASMGVNDYLAVFLHDAARLGAAAKVAGRLRALAALTDGPVVGLYAAHATALAAQDGTALDEVAGSFEAVGAMLLAAEAAAEAAVAHRAAGREHAARTSAVRSKLLADQCEGARTPALGLLEQPPGLTRREREIAGLAAAGLSNRAIAERLVVSVRTVDNHLQHAFDKLGIRSRRELGRLIGAPPPEQSPPRT